MMWEACSWANEHFGTSNEHHQASEGQIDTDEISCKGQIRTA